MTDVPHDDSALGHWAAEITYHAMGFAQAALDATALALIAALVLTGMPSRPAAPIVPFPMVTVTCLDDCIETRPLASGS